MGNSSSLPMMGNTTTTDPVNQVEKLNVKDSKVAEEDPLNRRNEEGKSQDEQPTHFNAEKGIFHLNLTEFCGSLETEYKDCVQKTHLADHPYDYSATYSVLCAEQWHRLKKCMMLKYRYMSDYDADHSSLDVLMTPELIDEWADEEIVHDILENERNKRKKDFQKFVEEKKAKEEEEM